MNETYNTDIWKLSFLVKATIVPLVATVLCFKNLFKVSWSHWLFSWYFQIKHSNLFVLLIDFPEQVLSNAIQDDFDRYTNGREDKSTKPSFEVVFAYGKTKSFNCLQ